MELILRKGSQVLTLQLDDGIHLVGRDPNAQVQVDQRQVSARHAKLRVDGDRLFVSDLGSTNGTMINDVPLEPNQGEVEVRPDAIISFAGVLLERPPKDEAGTERFTAHGFYNLDQGFSQTAGMRIAPMLSGLFDLISAEGDTGSIEETACEFVSRWISADRVVMLEDGGEGTSLEKVGSWSASGDLTEDITLSQTIINRVMNARTSVLLMDVLDTTGGASESMLALNLRSAMAVPLFDNQRVRGILYVDTTQPNVRYSEDELQMVTATANAVAVKLRNRSMEKELATAARIQRAMLPHQLPSIPGHEVHGRLDMCRAVGGDLYHVLKRDNGNILIAVGDVAGKGTPAALAMSACMILVSTLAEIGDTVDGIMNLIHRKLLENLAPEQFITLFLGDLDPATGSLTYVNAGHEPPLISRADGVLDNLGSTGLPVAMLPDSMWLMEEAKLEKGDLLAIFSDGIPEATLEGDEFLGLEPMRATLVEQRDAPLETISDQVSEQIRSFLNGNPPSDDVTLLLLRRNS